MREFRGKVADENEWVYGYLVNKDTIFQPKEYPTSINCGFGKFGVIEETIGQDTGLIDLNDKKIFEGDIVKSIYDFYSCGYKEITTIGKVVMEGGIVYTQDKNGEILTYLPEIDTSQQCEVIGNIYDNPEILEKEKSFEIKGE